jgi:hypothetical protein
MRNLFLFLFCALLTSAGMAQSTKPLLEATKQFLNTLSAEETKKTVYDFNDSLRHKWK